MKLTPEQKAHRKYGMALGELKRLREEVIYHLGYYRGLKKHEVILILRKRLYCRNALVRDAWQKRAACRAWVPMEERYCDNCRHYKLTRSTPICVDCTKWADPVKWEPRKEARND